MITNFLVFFQKGADKLFTECFLGFGGQNSWQIL